MCFTSFNEDEDEDDDDDDSGEEEEEDNNTYPPTKPTINAFLVLPEALW